MNRPLETAPAREAQIRIRAMSRNSNTELTDLATHIVDGRVDLSTLTTEFHQH